MKPWVDFYDLMMPDLPGCPFLMMDNALRQSAIAFCEQSLAWRCDHPPVPVVPGTAEYAFAPPAETVVHAITHAALDDREIECHTGEDDIGIAGWRSQAGTPRYVLGGTASFTLVPAPDMAGTLTMTVAVKPSPTAMGLDDSQFNEFREAIVHGALARLMLSPKKPYGDAQLAQYHQRQFDIKTAAASMRVARSFTRAPLRTVIPGRG